MTVSTAGDEPSPGFVAVGRVLGGWGLKGALKIESLSDFPERFQRGAEVWLRGERHVVERRHTSGRSLVIKLSGIEDPDAVSPLRGSLIEWPERDLPALAEGEYYQHDLIGLGVVTEGGEALGTVVSLLPTGANAVLVVRGERGEYLLPLIADVVHRVDLEGQTLTVELLPGLEPTPVGIRTARPAVHKTRGSRDRRPAPPGAEAHDAGPERQAAGAFAGDSEADPEP